MKGQYKQRLFSNRDFAGVISFQRFQLNNSYRHLMKPAEAKTHQMVNHKRNKTASVGLIFIKNVYFVVTFIVKQNRKIQVNFFPFISYLVAQQKPILSVAF